MMTLQNTVKSTVNPNIIKAMYLQMKRLFKILFKQIIYSL